MVLVLSILYLLLSLLLAFGLTELVGSQVNRGSFFAVALFFMLIIPGFGLLGILIYSLWLFLSSPFQSKVRFNKNNLGEFHVEKVIRRRSYGEGGAMIMLFQQEASLSGRLNSIVKLNVSQSALSNQVNKMLLSDNNDELRLLAYSLLSQQEKSLFSTIEYFESAYKQDGGSARLALLLAEFYWELLYLDVAQDEIKSFITSKVKFYIEAGLVQDSESADLLLMSGKFLLRQRDWQQAEQQFKLSLKHGAAYYKVAPFLAEIAFNQGNYEEVKKYFKQVGETLLSNPKIASVARYWLGGVDARS